MIKQWTRCMYRMSERCFHFKICLSSVWIKKSVPPVWAQAIKILQSVWPSFYSQMHLTRIKLFGCWLSLHSWEVDFISRWECAENQMWAFKLCLIIMLCIVKANRWLSSGEWRTDKPCEMFPTVLKYVLLPFDIKLSLFRKQTKLKFIAKIDLNRTSRNTFSWNTLFVFLYSVKMLQGCLKWKLTMVYIGHWRTTECACIVTQTSPVFLFMSLLWVLEIKND